MENSKELIELNDTKETILLENGVSFVDNDKFLDYIKKEKFNDDDNSLSYKKIEETRVCDFLKIKIAIKSVGFYLVTLKNNDENNQKIPEIIEKVKELKDDNELDLEKQCEKIKKVANILNEYNLMFSFFVLQKQIPEHYIDFDDSKLNFPLIFINDYKKEKPKEEQTKNENKTKDLKVILNRLFSVDHLFNLLFCLFVCFSLHISTSLFSNGDWKGALFLILFLAILGILNYCLYSSFYVKESKENKFEKLIVGLYLGLGSSIGLIIGICVSQFYLNIGYSFVIGLFNVIGFALCVCAIFSSRLLKLLFKPKKE